MKLLNKTLAIIVLTLLGMILLMHVASQVILLDSYAVMEDNYMQVEVGGTLSAMEYDLSQLDTVTVDYAYWDDTYELIRQPNITDDHPYISSNFVDTTFKMQRLNVIALLDSGGNIAYARAYDLDNRSFTDIPAGFSGVIGPGSPLFRTGSADGTHGIVMVDGKPLMVSAYPIRNSDADQPSRGTMIMGRFLDEIEIETMSRITGKPIDFKLYSDPALPEGYSKARSGAVRDGQVIVEPVDDNTVSGYTIVDDVFGNPALILRIDQPRFMYQQGKSALTYLILSLFLAGIVFSIVTVFLLEKLVISPISRLGQTVHLIGEKDDMSRRVEVTGNDEVAMLAKTVNKTLDTLQASREKRFADEQKFRNLVENISDIVIELNDQYEFTYVSPNVKAILGYEPREVLGKRIQELASGETISMLRNMSTQLLTAGQPIALINVEIVDKVGRVIDMEFSGTKIVDQQGRVTGFHGIARDVRERRKVERALRKWADIFQLARIPITILGPREAKLDMVNPAFFQLYGYGAGDMDGMRFEEVFDPEYRDGLPGHMAVADDRGHHVFESRHIHKDGSGFPVIVDVSVVRDSHDDLLYRVINVQDITERKQAEEALHRAYDEVMKSNTALQEENTERRKVEQQITASLIEKEVLLKEIHHRVKNNLQIISSLLNLQSCNTGAESATAFKESQNRIKSMALIHEKLYQSRDLSHIDFAEYATSLTAYLARSYTSNPGVNFSIDISNISLDIDQAIPCGLIINELVSNSLKYAFTDGRPGRILVSLHRDGDMYTLKVGDSGVGLPAGFDYRDSPSLGLQLVNTLVEQIEGTIELDRTSGTAFTIRFGEKGEEAKSNAR